MPPALTRLGQLDVRRFLREYWQRRPVVVRAALPGWRSPLGRAALFALAARDDVESRLVERRGRRWTLRHGPFPRRALPPLAQGGWTLLVQGVDGVDAAVHELLGRFRFVPDARLDDIMVSYASSGGGVGPHVDNYDVFLLQAEGCRRWRISAQRELAVQTGQPLRLLAGFRPTREWLLAPGDLLYLPPGVAHDGVAEGACMTLSVGFRAPAWRELLDPWFAAFAEHAAPPGRYADPGLVPTRHPGRLPATMVEEAHAVLARVRPRIADTERFLLRHLSEPKAQVVFEPLRRPPAPRVFLRAARRRGLVLDRRTRLLCGRRGVGINGEFIALAPAPLAAAGELADRRRLARESLRQIPQALAARLYEWYAAGWLRLGPRR